MSAHNEPPTIVELLTEPKVYLAGVIEDGFALLEEFVEGEEQPLSRPVLRYTFTNTKGTVVQVLNYGVTVTTVSVADRAGLFDDIALGFEDLQGYRDNVDCYLGCTLGRLANRVSRGRFQLDGRVYDLTLGEAHINGGLLGLSHVLWNSRMDGHTVIFTYLSLDGEEGYPGNMMVTTKVSLANDNALRFVTTAVTDQATPCSITNHTRFNLAGHMKGPVSLGEHVAIINADKYLDTFDDNIPTGEIKHVGCTVLDLRIHRLLSRLVPLVPRGGFDHAYCINGGKDDGVRFVGRVLHPKSGRVLEVFSDQPVAQFSTSRDLPAVEVPGVNVLPQGEGEGDDIPLVVKDSTEEADVWEPEGGEGGEGGEGEEVEELPPPKREVIGKGGALYEQHGAFSITPQGFPNAVNNRNFPDVILRPGETYSHTMEYRFGVVVKVKKYVAEAMANGPDDEEPAESSSIHSGASRKSSEETGQVGEQPVEGEQQEQ